MTLLEKWIKENAKEGANIDEALGLVKDLDPLKNIQTKDEALTFMERNTAFRSALDFETTRRAEKAIETFKEKRLPDLLKENEEKVRAEISPNDTPEQKEIRELKEWQQNQLKKEKQYEQKAMLRNKAKELAEQEGVQFDPLRAEKYYVFGDDAENVLLDEIKYLKSTIETELSTKLKGQFGTQQPSASTKTPDQNIDLQLAEARKNGDLLAASKLFLEKQTQQAE